MTSLVLGKYFRGRGRKKVTGGSGSDDERVTILRRLLSRCFSGKMASPSKGGIITSTGTCSNAGILLTADFQL